MPTTLEETRAEAEARGKRVITMHAAIAATTIGSTLGPAPAVPPLSGAGNLKSTRVSPQRNSSTQRSRLAATAAERKISGVKAIPYGKHASWYPACRCRQCRREVVVVEVVAGAAAGRRRSASRRYETREREKVLV